VEHPLFGVTLVQISVDLNISFGRYDCHLIFHSLSLTDFVCGICCGCLPGEEIIDKLWFLLPKSSGIQLLHFLFSVIGTNAESRIGIWGKQFRETSAQF
jgi:hypothetical protein